MADLLTAPDNETAVADYEMNGAVQVAPNSVYTVWPLYIAPENYIDCIITRSFAYAT